MRFPFLQPSAGTGQLRRSACLLSAAAIVAGSLAWYGPTHVRAASPTVPANVRLSPGAVTNDGMVVITWDAPNDANTAYYQIFRVNGASAAKASEVTYIGRTEDPRNYFIDQTPTEGVFQYAVIAVDSAANASMPSGWAKVTADFPSNGIGKIEPDVTAPPTPGNFHAGMVSANGNTVSLGWNQGTNGDLWRCIVYRQDNNGTPKPAGYTEGANNSFTDTVPGDGNYNYYVVAQDKTGNVSPPTATAGISVDSTAPGVDISTPVAGHTYNRSGTLTIVAGITDNGAGYEPTSIKFYLDDMLLGSPTISLANLAPGNHTARVEVTDRVGNTTNVSVQFVVAGDAVSSPTAPQGLTTPNYNDGTVTLSWSAPAAGNVTGYTVYRSSGSNGNPVVVGSTVAGITSFTDQVPADDRYGYFVVADDGSTASPASNAVYTIVDRTAPNIAINSPVAGKTYTNTGNLHIDVTVTDALSGIGGGNVKYWVDGVALGTSDIRLSNLTLGGHTFKVQATDRAGNATSASANFNVAAPANPGNGGDTPPANQTLIHLLISLKLDISEAQYNRLLAELRAGHNQTFIVLIVEYRGKFITVTSADKLLKAAGYKWQSDGKHEDDGDHDDDNGQHGQKGQHGNDDDHGKSHGKSKGHGGDHGGHDD